MLEGMPPALRSLLAVAVLAVAAAALRPAAPPVAVGAAAAFAAPTVDSRGRDFTFQDLAPDDAQAVRGAIDGARPEAQRLIGAVAGLVVVRVGDAGPDAAGTTRASAQGYDLELDLSGVRATLGARGIDRLVLHELGHVVDFALVPDAMLAGLDAQIPAGYGCEQGVLGGCAPAQERFAETFAKWAMDDIGVRLEIGYKVPPPAVALAAWGTPLAGLAR